MIVEKFRIEIGGKPMRLYINARTKERCADEDIPADSFSCYADAEKKAVAWGLKEFMITPYQRDIGTPTKLTEIGL